MAEIKRVLVPDIGNFKDVKVIEVLVKAGDKVNAEDGVITLETDKAAMDVPAPFAGVVKEVQVKAGDKVSQGSLILLLEGDATASAPAAQSAAAVTVPVAASSAAAAQTTNPSPSLSLPWEEAAPPSLTRLGREEFGFNTDGVEEFAGEPKELAHASPAIRRFARELGADLAQIKGSGAKGRVTKGDVQNFVKAALAQPRGTTGRGPQVPTMPPPRLLPQTAGFAITSDLAGVVGSPSRMSSSFISNVSEADGMTRCAQASGAGMPPPRLLPQTAGFASNVSEANFAQFGAIETKPLSRIQKISGANLHRNWVGIPHVTQFEQADITEMEIFRKQLGTEYAAQGIKITLLAFLLKAVVEALQQFPDFNASLDASGENLVLKRYAHIGIAVDTPAGLVVPVIRDADCKGIVQLAQELGEVSARARDKKLAAAEMQGGCFTISSLGGIGGTAFTPIINAPEVAILGVSRASMKPVYQDGEFVPRLMLPLSLSYDHRVIDGAAAARFIVYLSKVLADVRRLAL